MEEDVLKYIEENELMQDSDDGRSFEEWSEEIKTKYLNYEDDNK